MATAEPTPDAAARWQALPAYLRREAARVLELPAERVPEDRPLTALGLDSLAAVELQHRVEQDLGVEIPAADLLEGASVRELAAEIRARVEAGSLAGEPLAASGLAEKGDLPASWGQRGLWALQSLAPEGAAYNLAAAARVRSGPSEPWGTTWGRLQEALAGLVERHAAWRTTFELRDGEPRRQVHAWLAPESVLHEAESWPEERVLAHVEEEAYRPFDLARGPLVRLAAWRRSGGELALLFAVHHTVADFWSLALAFGEIGARLDGPREGAVDGRAPSARVGPPPAVRYTDYVRWQERLLAGPRGEALEAFWRGRLAGGAPPLDLAADRPRPAVPSLRGGAASLALPADLAAGLRALARSTGATLHNALLAAFAALLDRHAGQAIERPEEVRIGSPAAGRTRAGLSGLVGYLVNPVVLRADLSGRPGFAELVARARTETLGALAHQEYPFALLAERLSPAQSPDPGQDRGLGREAGRIPGRQAGQVPLFQAMLVVLGGQHPRERELAAWALGVPAVPLRLGALALTSLPLPERTSQVDLTLRAADLGAEIALALQYDADLFDRSTALRMAGHLRQLLAAAVAEPLRPIAELPLFAEAERAQMLREWNDTDPSSLAADAGAAGLHALFEAQARATPGATALLAGGERHSYAELDGRANQLARFLRRAGVAPEEGGGGPLGRTADLVIGLLAVLKAGGTYVPLDPSYPEERLRFMAEDAGAARILTAERWRDRVPPGASAIVLDRERAAVAAESAGPLESRTAPGHLAYVLYTSGSTGRPKGVAVEHRSPMARVRWAARAFAPEERAVVLAATSASFDLSVFEIFVPLATGGTVALAENALALPALPTAAEVTLVNTVPSALAELLHADGLPAGVHAVNLAGEPLTGALARAIAAALPGCRVRNLYGPTEDTTYSTWAEVEIESPREPAIGRPLDGTRAYLLGPGLEPVPPGVPGELCLAGAGLARGYLGRPDLTAERFVPDPFGAPGARPIDPGGALGARLYCTGDLARYRPDGQIEFLGRLDQQVKVRGFRVELGEVEAALAALPEVREAAVAALQDRLVAWVVLASPGSASPAALRAALERLLPASMVPSAWLLLPALPRTANGKVDRRALPAIVGTAFDLGEARGPRDPIEELIAGIWCEVLDVAEAGPADRFFDLGGHSLSAARVISRVRQVFGVELSLSWLFESPTVAALAARLREAPGIAGPPLVPRPRDRAAVPLSFAQQRLWFLWQLAPESPFYNMPAAIRLSGPLDASALALALDEIVRRHESLRTRFPASGGRPVQQIDPPRPRPLATVDLRGLAEATNAEEAERLARTEARRPFDLTRGPLLRTLLLRLGEERHHLVVNLHHAIADGASIAVLYRELAALYPALAAGRPSRRSSPLPPLPVQYADFTLWQREVLDAATEARELAWWREQLAAPPPTDLPADRPRPAVQSFRGATLEAALSASLIAELRALSRRLGATLFMTLLAGFEALVHRYTSREDVAVGAPMAGRDRAEIEPLVGFFVNTLVLRTDHSGRPSFATAAARVRETALAAYAHQDLPFERIVEALSPERDAGRQPFFGQMFQLADLPPRRLALGDLILERLDLDAGTTTFDLALDLSHQDGGVEVRAVFAADLFDGATIRRLLGHFAGLLAAAVASPDLPLAELPLVGEAERHQALIGWEDQPPLARDEEALVHEQIAVHAEAAPDAVAVVCGTERLTYGELDRRAGRLARRLRALGIGAEVHPASEAVVAVVLDRSAGLSIALLAVLQAGGTYLPLDPAQPRERIAAALADAGARALLTRRGLSRPRSTFETTSDSALPLVLLEEAATPTGAAPTRERPPEIPRDSLAYVIFTSGSTGRPKGVGVSHRVLAHHVEAARRAFAIAPGEGVLQFAAASFDVSLEQLLPALASGARAVLRPEEIWSPAELLRRLAEEEVAVADLPAAYWHQLAREAANGALGTPPPSLRLVIAGGEAMQAEPLQRWREGPFAGIRLLNAYGPTETAVTAAAADLGAPAPEGPRHVAIGRAFGGRALYVLDGEGAPVPAGIPGELAVGGPLLARGYLGRPDLTAERFRPDPFGAEAGRLYHTGDRVRRMPDGRLEFLGRVDRQVKVRGFRIEPGEVEAALAAHPDVREAIVVARDFAAGGGSDRRLVAYVTLAPEAAADLDALHEGAERETWEREQVEQWRTVYDDDVYGELPDPTFNASGWASSYTRGPIPEPEMREWVEATASRVLGLLPPAARVLEIGCGTGLVLFRVAPHAARYVGTDFSAVALGHTRAVLDGLSAALPVELVLAPAHDLSALGDERFDAVLLNSVVQYFPSAAYLERVLAGALARVAPGGCLFVGDVRSLPLLAAFHASVELHRAGAGTPRERLRRRVEARAATDPELVLDPAFFTAMAQRLPGVAGVAGIEILLRRGRHRNEMTRFRYDAVLHIESRTEGGARPPTGLAGALRIDWEAGGLSLAELRRRLAEEEPALLAVQRIPNDRVAADARALALLRQPDGPRTAGEIAQAAAEPAAAGLAGAANAVDPEDLWSLAHGLGYETGVTWSRDPARVDAVFLRRREGAPRQPLPGLEPPPAAGQALASDPLGRRRARQLAPRLKAFAAERLPAPLVPADVVVLDELPLTSRGKVDLAALPVPERETADLSAGFVAPRTFEERTVASLWADLLGVDPVGAEDDFFALGGHSLLATQVLARLRQETGVELELREIFAAPTVAGLAAALAARREAAEGRRAGGARGGPAPAPRTPLTPLAPLAPIPRASGPTALPLSPGQRRLWFLHRFDPAAAAYNMAGAFRLSGRLDAAALAQALGDIARRHEVLRTTYALAGEEPVQVVPPPGAPAAPAGLPWTLPLADLSALPVGRREAEARRLAAEERARPFDLARGPVWRGALVRLGRREHLALVTIHHIAADGWSIGVLLGELSKLYAAYLAGKPSPLPELPLQYGDFAAWQGRALAGPAVAAQLAWWRERLAGAPPLLDLPTDRPRPVVRSGVAGRVPVALPPALAGRLAGLARAEGTTLFTVLLAGFQALLGRLTHAEDLAVGTPVAGRRQAETAGLIGFFVNTLALRADLAGAPSFRDHLGRTREAVLDALAHQDLPFERLVEELQPERSLAHAPLFQVLFALQNAPAGPLELPGLDLTPLAPEPRALFDLELDLEEAAGTSGAGLAGSLVYAHDIFDGASAERIAGHLAVLLAGAVDRPEARISALPLLRPEEVAEIAALARGPALAAPPAATVLDLIAGQAARAPEAVAVAADGALLSYGELERRAGGLAARLAALGVVPGEIVALESARTPELAIGLLGILRAGAAFLPLDPALPPARADLLLGDAGVRWRVVSGAKEDPGAAPLGDVRYRIEATRKQALMASPSLAAVPSPVADDPGPRSLAYVIYTSGTTGRPKGVMVEHGSLLHTLSALLGTSSFRPGERLVSIAPFAFDIFLFELLAPLASGGSVELLPLRPGLDLDRLAETLAAADRFHAVPAVLRQVVERGEHNPRPALREVYVGGDLVPPELPGEARAAFPRARVTVLYGPTESTIVCAGDPAPASAQPRPLLGRPLPGAILELLDRSGERVPLGIAGEIHVAGPGVARGYLGRPERTAERFLPAPNGARRYRTGDLARRRPDGLLEFLGRADQQVKVRGIRVEPGEIEARLAEHPGVRRAAVVAREDAAGGKRLAAFFVPVATSTAEAPSAAELREHLRRTLPEALIPAAFAPLAELPLSPTGKVDRRALAALDLPAGEEAPERETGTSARDPEEEIVAGLWADLLGLERLGPHEDVFQRGAHSLLVGRMAARLCDAFGVELPLRALFEEPTAAGLARRLAAARMEARQGEEPPLAPVPRDGELPLSFAQQRLWFLEQMEPGSPLYHIPAGLRLSGRLDVAALASALAEVVRRHEALRTSFPVDGGRPRQHIAEAASAAGRSRLPVADLSALPLELREEEARRLGLAEVRRPFDLATGPLLRSLLLRLADSPGEPVHALLLVVHHIVSDGGSTAVLVREVASLYAAFAAGRPSRLPALPVQYADFAVWQRRRLAGEALDAQLAFWRRRLEGAPPVLELPLDHPRPPVRGTRGGEVPVHLPAELVSALARLGRREGATLFMTLLAGFAALLHRASGQEDLHVGTPIAGRGRTELEGLIGFFANTLVMRSQAAGDPSFKRHLAGIREMALDAYAHQDLPFERLVEELAPVRDPARTPLFQAAFALEERAPEVRGLPSLAATPLHLPAETAKFDLTLSLAGGGADLGGALEYAADLFDRATVERLVRQLARLLRAASADPEIRLGDLPLLGEAERHQVTIEWAAEWAGEELGEWHGDRTLPELFAGQVARTPHRPALAAGNVRLTYAELDRRAARLARRLRAAGVAPEEPVAVLLERSAGLVIALLAVIEAGAAYLPLDPADPPARLAFLLADSGVRTLLAGALPEGFEPGSEVRRIDPGDLGAADEHGAAEAETEAMESPETGPRTTPASLAYVMYTSGSTGKPKGVDVTHRAVVRLARGVARYAPLGPGDRVAQAANVAFDAATFEIWGALLNGAELVVPPSGRASLKELGDFVAREAITTLWLTTGLFHQMVDGPIAQLASLRRVLTGGEAVSAAHVRRFLATLPGRPVVHAYGPTENTTFTTCRVFTEPEAATSPLPLGRSIAGTYVRLLDAAGRPVPPGVAGELYAGGDGLARGYRRRPELTAERFVPDPGPGGGVGAPGTRPVGLGAAPGARPADLGAAPGARLYRTGDLARWRADGEIEFLGRLDGQVKVRGFRVEVGEVEAAAATHPAVREVAVLAVPDPAGGVRLAAYVVPAEGTARESAARDSSGLRAWLRGRLPEAMVPAAITWLDALPVTANGKVDRRALARIEVRPEPHGGGAAPRGPFEEALAGIWSEVLQVGGQEISRDDDFFALGGHSLLATQVASRLRTAFAVELPLADLFAAPRLADLAARLEAEHRRGAGLAAPPIVQAPRGAHSAVPLSFGQEWMWIADQLAPDAAAYNAPLAVHLRGTLDAAALAAAVRAVAGRHEVLRSRFVAGPEGPLQVPAADLFPAFAVADLAALPRAERWIEASRLAAAEAARPFDLAAGPPLRSLLLRLEGEDHLLFLGIHHLATDGWSAGVLLRETAALYEAALAGTPSPLPELPIQYADFALWQRRWLAGEVRERLLDWWREQLRGPLPVLELPTDRSSPARGGLGERLAWRLDPRTAAALHALARERGTTLFSVLLAAFATLLGRYARQDDLVIGSPVANRTRQELEGLVGYFVHDLALRADLASDPMLPELLARLHAVALGAWAHQDLPIATVLQEIQPGTGGAPPFQVWFQLQNTPLPSLSLPGLTLTPHELEARAATFELELLALEEAGGLGGHLVYDRERFHRATAAGLLRGFLILIDGIAESPERRLSELPLLAPEERQALLHEHDRALHCPGATPLHRSFEKVASARPDAIAATFEGEALSYGELDRRANVLARRLNALGVAPESRVGLAASRSLALVIGILGILKAGGAYVPLDPDYPRERLEMLQADAGIAVLVVAGATGERLAESSSLPVVSAVSPGLDADSTPTHAPEAHPDPLAYVIYTSGSTGRPKGVMVTHRQAARLFEATRDLGHGPEDVWTLFHSYAFDFSVWELWGALALGGRLVVVPREVSRTPEAFFELLAREGVTVLNQTPSAFYPLQRAGEGRADLPALRQVLFGGEALEPAKLLPWLDRHGDRRPVLLNLYGITETTVHATLYPLSRADAEGLSKSPIGRALDDLRLYVLDPALDLAPAGAIGEILVGGGGVARGYIGRPDLTAERFVPDPFSEEPGARLYRSGDLARRRANGEIEYLGRADQQLKVRGFRIEPGEVEAALVRHPAIARAAVVARRLSAEDVRLVACLVLQPGLAMPQGEELRAHLLALLPEPWVPGSFVALPDLPLTPNGKVDRRVLADLAAGAEAAAGGDAGAGEAPGTPLESLLAGIWAALLEVPRVGRDESFFALGGHSLLMTRVAARVREAVGVAPPMRSFFDRPTVASLATGVLDELAERAGHERLEALLAEVRALADEDVASRLAEKRAAWVVRGQALSGAAPTTAPQTREAPAEVPAAERVLAPPLRLTIEEREHARGLAPSFAKDGDAIARLAQQGIEPRVRDVLAAMAPASAEAADDGLRVETVAMPTRDRPEVLERGIASYAEAALAQGRTLRFAVLDDSSDPAMRAEYGRRLSALSRRFGVEVLYAGPDEKRRFAARLAAEGLSPTAVTEALGDPERVGVPVGANRNALLLATAGEGVLSVDDDTLSRGGPPAESLPGIAFRSGTRPGTAFLSGSDPGEVRAFVERAEALSAIDPRPLDLAGAHEQLLGRDLRSWISGLDPEAPAALDAGDPSFLRALATGGRVLVTTNGWAGDCGWRVPTFYMLLGGESWRRLTRSAAGYRAATASKEIVRFVPRATVGNGDSFLATLFTGLDNRRLLPPFPPVLWGEDLLFGITLQLAFAGARVGHLPGVATHEPVERRAFWPGEMVRSASGVDHSRLVSALLDGFAPDPALDGAAGLRRLGAYLGEIGRLAPAAFDDLARQRVRARAEALAAHLADRLATFRAEGAPAGGEPWAEDVQRYLGLLHRHLAEPELAVPLDLLYGRGLDEARRLSQRLIANHATVLDAWPEIVEAARSLRGSGLGLAEAVP